MSDGSWGRRGRVALGTCLLVGVLSLVPAAAQADVVWLCNPDLAPAVDPCQTPLDTTVLHADGTSEVQRPDRPAAAARPVDCFYVYPTVSNQLGPNATKAKDPEVVAVAKFQASRFSAGCRMFAPMYRESTVAGVAGNSLSANAELSYGDVAEAWRSYLEHDNHGRGVILIGHSQGSLMLRALIHRVIDGDPAVRRRLVGAFLLGGNVTTRAGSTVGGDFAHVPVCTQRGQDGCVVAYSTSSTDPEPVSFFGNTNTNVIGGVFGLPTGPGYQVACTDPGTLSGLTAPVALTIPTSPYPPGFIAGGIAVTANGPVPTAATTWVQAFAYQGACRTINGANVFRYHPVDGSRRLTEFPPAWGTHLVDFNLGVDQLTTIARLQTQSWLGPGLTVGRPRTAAAGASVVVAVPGAGTVTVTAARRIRRQVYTLDAPGRIRLRITPSARTARMLARGRTATIRVTITYRPAGTAPISRHLTVRLHRR